MNVGKREVSEMLSRSAESMRAHIDLLSEIDSEFGDGDHGIAVAKICACLDGQIEVWDSSDCDIHDFFDRVSSAIMDVNGGSAGSLYGTFFAGMAAAVNPGIRELDVVGVKGLFVGAVQGLSAITPARAGDKTMMDALIPASEAAGACEGDVPEVLAAAATAAQSGAEATKSMLPKYGRVRLYGAEAIGTPDVGALSMAFLIKGLSQPYEAIEDDKP